MLTKTCQLNSLDKTISEGVLSRQHKRILLALTVYEWRTRLGLHTATGISISSLCARLSELQKAGFVTTDGTTWCATTNRYVTIYRRVDGRLNEGHSPEEGKEVTVPNPS